MTEKKAVILLSGGLDSATCLALAVKQGFEAHTISFHYGQRHEIELMAATKLAAKLGAASHRVAHIDLGIFGGSALTDASMVVPKDRNEAQLSTGIPITYVPARNTVFLSYALGLAEVTGSQDIFIGVNALDYSGYPDCRPEFIEAYETMANLATKASTQDGRRLTIHAPLMHMTKADIVTLGTKLGVDYSMSISCYDPSPSGEACGHCDSCQLRRRGFKDAGLMDPTIYKDGEA